jgi:hypothetical protein
MGKSHKFLHGQVEYPLKAATTNSLLLDADPALYWALELLSSAIETYAGPRLLAQAAREGINFPSAVEKTIHFEPTPYLLSDQFVFPLLCIYRMEETWNEHTISHNKDSSVWDWAYVLPPLTPRQIEQLHPILRTVAVVVATFAMQSFDPEYNADSTLRDLAGIQKMSAGPVRYGDFEAIDENKRWWRAVSGRLLVWERGDIALSNLDPFEGADTAIDLTEPSGTKVVAFSEISTDAPFVLESIAPESGSKAGGTLVEITGKNFRPGKRPPRVVIGGAHAASVVVTHPTRLVCVTPEHQAHPTFAADVQAINLDDGQASNVLEGAFTFTTP